MHSGNIFIWRPISWRRLIIPTYSTTIIYHYKTGQICVNWLYWYIFPWMDLLPVHRRIEWFSCRWKRISGLWVIWTKSADTLHCLTQLPVAEQLLACCRWTCRCYGGRNDLFRWWHRCQNGGVTNNDWWTARQYHRISKDIPQQNR